MTDVYESKLAKFVGWLNHAERGYAITLGQTTFYSSPKEAVLRDVRWMRHEDRHKAQWREDGALKFFFLYVWYSIRFGYWKNPYEIDARNHEGNP